MSDDLVKRLNQTLGGISSPPVLDGDNLSILLCSAFEDDGEQNENGWTDAAIEGCEQTLQAIRNHYAPLADRIEELDDIIRHDRKRIEELVSMVNSKDARIEELQAKLAKALDGLHEAESAPEPDHYVPQFRYVMDIIGATLAELKGETDD